MSGVFLALLMAGCGKNNPAGFADIAAPDNLVATVISSRQIELTWNDNSDNERGFHIERSRGGLEEVIEVASNSTRLRQTMLRPQSRYAFRVRAFNENGHSRYSAMVEATTLENKTAWFESDTRVEVHLLGAAISENRIALAVGERGMVLRSEDDSQSWSRPFSRTENTLTAIDFLNADFGAAAGSIFPENFTVIAQTLTAGREWILREPGLQIDLRAIAMVSRDTLVAAGLGGSILRSVDGGATWSQIATPTNSDLFGLAFFNAETGLVVGAGGTILKSSNGGASWSLQRSGGDILYDVAVSGSDVALAVGAGGLILQTHDRGETWTIPDSPVAADLHAVSLLPSGSGWTVGSNGIVLHTTDGGLSWQPQQSGTSNTLLDVHSLDEQVAMAVGEYGTVLFTTNAGG